MKKNNFILIVIIFFLCKTSHLLASIDSVQKKNVFSNTSLVQFIQSLEDKFQVKIDVHGSVDSQDLVIKSGDFSLHDSLAQFFEINNIKNSSFILNEKDNVAEVWILHNQEGAKSNSVVGSIAEKKDGHSADEIPQNDSEFASSSTPRTEFTDKEIEQLENDHREYEKSGLRPRDEFTEEELRQLEEDRLKYENSESMRKSDFSEEELKQLEEKR